MNFNAFRHVIAVCLKGFFTDEDCVKVEIYMETPKSPLFGVITATH